MLEIKKLYSEPKTFDPITFVDGINLILGTTTENNIKTNGVGKSMAIEFINYGLLKKHDESRVILIPNEAFSHDTQICLDFEINNKVTIKRSIKDSQSPFMIVNGKETKYANLQDATELLTTLLFGTSNDSSIPSFISMMGPLIRDERSEFKSIIQCYDTKRNIPPDYTPHLYLLNIDPNPYNSAKKLSLDIDKLTNQVNRIQDDLNRLENTAGYEIIAQEIINIENEIEQERSQEAFLKSELSKIKLFSGDNYIEDNEIAELYNQFKDGLGDIIKKEIQEVTVFKQKIDNFQRTLIDNRKKSLTDELKTLNEKISWLEKQHKGKTSILDQKGFLKNLKQTIATHQHKVEEQSALSSFIKKYNGYDHEKRDKEIVNFDLRIHDDGSHSNEREKVFLYDLALLINSHTSERHPGLLIHDNIFHVDEEIFGRER